MSFKEKLYNTAGLIVRRSGLYKFMRFRDDERPRFPHKLVYMCGREGQRYLNASLASVYFNWEKLPEVIVISDGTPLNDIIKWPRKLEVISWKEAYDYYEQKGNKGLCAYAQALVYGKKAISLLYLSEKFHFILYSDTDVLWYSSPKEPVVPVGRPYLKMGKDLAHGFYDAYLLKALGEEKCLDNVPFNSGLMYIQGELSDYPEWDELCYHLGTKESLEAQPNFSEQTLFAIFANHFNPADYWTPKEVLITTDDTYTLKYTGKHFPKIIARHYVNSRRVAFWRDFVFMSLGKKTPVPQHRSTSLTS